MSHWQPASQIFLLLPMKFAISHKIERPANFGRDSHVGSWQHQIIFHLPHCHQPIIPQLVTHLSTSSKAVKRMADPV